MDAALRPLDGKLDYQRLACGLRTDKPGTAWKRWPHAVNAISKSFPARKARVMTFKEEPSDARGTRKEKTSRILVTVGGKGLRAR